MKRTVCGGLAGVGIAASLTCGGGAPFATDEDNPIFVPVSMGRVSNDGGATRGVGWADFDGDGDPDLVTANTSGQWNAFYLNTRRGRRDDWREDSTPRDLEPESPASSFIKASDPAVSPLGSIAAARGNAEGVSWVDYDGDGDLDLHLVTRGIEPDLLFENRGSEGLTPVMEGPLVQNRSHTMACWADVDRDGWLDVFLVGYRSEFGNVLMRNLGGGTFEEVGETVFPAASKTGRACAWGDPNDDGLPDLYVGNAREPNDLFWNRGFLTFEQDQSESHAVRHVGYTYGLSWADFDGDGNQDLFVANFDTVNVLYRNDGSGRLEPVESDPIAGEGGGASKGHAWGDYDLDGDLDLFVANGTYGPDMRNFLYVNDDGGFLRELRGAFTQHADTSAGAAWADYDGDGDLDVYVANWGSKDQVNRLYRNTSADVTNRSWIAFRLRSVSPNRFGWGAKVRVMARIGGDFRWVTRWNIPTTGYGSQNEMMVHFGLSNAESVDSLVVRWPSGQVDRMGAFQARRVWVVEETDDDSPSENPPDDFLTPIRRPGVKSAEISPYALQRSAMMLVSSSPPGSDFISERRRGVLWDSAPNTYGGSIRW